MKQLVFICQAVVQIFVGLGATISGTLLIIVPSGVLLQMPPDMLKDSPFYNFLIPGIILLLVNGLGQFVAGVLTIRRHPSGGFIGAVFGMGLMIWIFVQVSMIGGGHILQYIYFSLGLLETAFSFLINDYLSILSKQSSTSDGKQPAN